MITWADRVNNLRRAWGREPTMQELLIAAEVHIMTPEEEAEHARSWARSCEPSAIEIRRRSEEAMARVREVQARLVKQFNEEIAPRLMFTTWAVLYEATMRKALGEDQ